MKKRMLSTFLVLFIIIGQIFPVCASVNATTRVDFSSLNMNPNVQKLVGTATKMNYNGDTVVYLQRFNKTPEAGHANFYFDLYANGNYITRKAVSSAGTVTIPLDDPREAYGVSFSLYGLNINYEGVHISLDGYWEL